MGTERRQSLQDPESNPGLEPDSLGAEEAGIKWAKITLFRAGRSPVSGGECTGNKAEMYIKVSCGMSSKPQVQAFPPLSGLLTVERELFDSLKFTRTSHQGLNEWDSLPIRDQIKDFRASQEWRGKKGGDKKKKG